jgi:NADP-dependent 3-hydroxy acid dehydrogenase YdfG
MSNRSLDCIPGESSPRAPAAPRPGVATELPDSITEPDVAENVHGFYEACAIPADSFARAVAFAMSQPEDVDINEILFRPTRQEL